MAQDFLHRYTNLPALIYLLKERKITLLDPQSWDDKNDSYFLQLYKEKKNLKTVLALCFTQQGETYQHWHIFAPGSSGIRVEFRREPLLKALKKKAGIRDGRVDYLTLNGIDKTPIALEKLPFLKRHAFKPEDEYRLTFESKTTKMPSLNIPIPLTCIRRITLSPWMPPVLDAHVKDVIKTLAPRAKIYRSTLISNDRWKKAGEGAV
ncbi:MAG TPA: hypothetical protein VH206_14245 [Xanthobacteraceae bacterium]|jgi:hypothetical protein|nr:hypothetical protein [Xanthobacteraceae bacterium]